jgi:glutaryl-CoA dehydrogenase
VQEEDRLQGVDSFADINALLLASRIAVAWEAVGLQLAAYDAARRHVLERQQFGRPLAAFQLVQQQLVKMLGNATASLAMMAQVAALQDQGAADMGQAALAKAFTTERMRETVALGRSLFGGNGILSDHPMAKLFADAEAIYTYEGTYEINSLIAGRAATGISAFT